LKINRRKFIKYSLVGVLGAIIAPGSLAAAAGKPAAAAYPNPLFTGALGRYEGISIHHNPGEALADRAFFEGEQWSQAQMDLFIRGKVAVKVAHPSNKCEWIPINKMIRPGGRRKGRG